MSATSSPVSHQESEATSASRVAFEAHFRRTRGVVELERAGAGYRNGLAQDAWMDWQAGAASAQPAVAVANDQAIIDCFTKAGVWLGVNPDEVARNVQAVKHAIQQFKALAAPGADDLVPGIGHPTTYADLARLTPVQLWNRWYPHDRSVSAKEAFIAARTIPFAAPAPAPAPTVTQADGFPRLWAALRRADKVVVATSANESYLPVPYGDAEKYTIVELAPLGLAAGGRGSRDAALLRWLMANPTWGMRWRLKAGKEQWQMVNDGESSGKWGDFREVLQAAATAHPARHADQVEAGAYACAAPRPVIKSEAQHRADFELALKGNNLKRFHEVSHAAYKDAMIENMWRGWLRKAKFDGATQY
jgi:hypothetical protein